jgi:protein TonB
MEVKKTPKASLEDKKSAWFLVGYVVILAILFVAFEWSERDVKIDTSAALVDLVFEEEVAPVSQMDQPIAPPPVEAAAAAVVTTIEALNIVDNSATVANVQFSTEETGERVEVRTITEVKAVKVEAEEEPEEQAIFEVVEEMPEYPGGMSALMQYLAQNIKYPTIAQENGTQGRVIVQFVVNRDGSIVDPVVVRSVDPYLDKEALRVIAAMPKWKPGMQRGKSVRVKYTVPVAFRLQ